MNGKELVEEVCHQLVEEESDGGRVVEEVRHLLVEEDRLDVVEVIVVSSKVTAGLSPGRNQSTQAE